MWQLGLVNNQPILQVYDHNTLYSLPLAKVSIFNLYPESELRPYVYS